MYWRERVPLGGLNANTMEEKKGKTRVVKGAKGKVGRGDVKLRGTPAPPPGGKSFLTPKQAQNRHVDPFTPPGSTMVTVRQGSAPRTGSAKSSPGSPLEATPAPQSPEAVPPTRQASPIAIPRLATPPPANPFLLPPQAPAHLGKLTVIFDLDETLVSNRRPGQSPAIARNYLIHMFQLLKGLVEVVMWTASTEDTGRPVVQQIDPKGEFFHHVIYRDQRWFTDGSHTKDLKLLGREMDRVVIVENTPNCCKLNPQNAIMVEDFVGDLSKTDRTLLNVAQIIRGAAENLTKKIGVQRYLRYYSKVPGSSIDVYELGLPLAYLKLGEQEALARVKTLDPLMRPPLGLYFYVKTN